LTFNPGSTPILLTREYEEPKRLCDGAGPLRGRVIEYGDE
jgi:hypothetical protein